MSGLFSIFLNIMALCMVLGVTFHYYAKLQDNLKRNRTEAFDFGRPARR